jgi:hypothetical protein
MDRPFVHISTEEGPLLLNLSQIVNVTSPKGKEDELTLHMSNGHSFTFHDDLVDRLVVLLQQYTIDTRGKILPIANIDEEVERELAKETTQDSDAQSSNR